MVKWKVVQGMKGDVMVMKREGMNEGKGKKMKYEKVYYVGEKDLYVKSDEKGN